MAIDNCKHSFQELSKIILPQYMKNMWEKITSPVQMSIFAEKGVGKATAFNKFGIQKDFSGCYVLIENDSPIYVGISRSIIIREFKVFGLFNFVMLLSLIYVFINK